MKIKELIKLLEIESVSGQEYKVSDYLYKELQRLKFKVSRDELGNVYATRGTAGKYGYPMLNAHMDIVDISYNGRYSYDFEPSINNDAMSYIIDTIGMSSLKELYNCQDCKFNTLCDGSLDLCEMFTPDSVVANELLDWYDILDIKDIPLSSLCNNPIYGEMPYVITNTNGVLKGNRTDRVLGGDDKCGIFIALEVARATKKPMKILFTVQEEIGCIGIDYVVNNNPEFFEDVAYSITIDRRGGEDLLPSQLGIPSCTRSFSAEIGKHGILAGIDIKIKDGGLSDTVVIRDHVVNAVNISAGYHKPHTGEEYIVLEEVSKIIEWVKRIIINVKE